LSLESLLALLAELLGAAGVPYMLTGSLAGSYHGAPRATQDIDLVVDASVESLLEVAANLRAAGLYVSDDAIREAVSTRGLFNAIDPETGWKIDFILRKDRPFSFLEFERRREIQFLGLSLSVARAEDVVVAKLEWAKLGDSERQIRDVAEIVAVQGDALDIIQIERWAEELGVRSQWQKVLEMNRPGGESV
jgi:hypothetical protein